MIAHLSLSTFAFIAVFMGGAAAQSANTSTAIVKNADGATVGKIDLAQVSDGVVVKRAWKGRPPGDAACHVHALGKCEPPFTSAGGHFNPDNKKHGMMS